MVNNLLGQLQMRINLCANPIFRQVAHKPFEDFSYTPSAFLVHPSYFKIAFARTYRRLAQSKTSTLGLPFGQTRGLVCRLLTGLFI